MLSTHDKKVNTILQAYLVGLHLSTCLDEVKDTEFYRHELKQRLNALEQTLIKIWDKSFAELYTIGSDDANMFNYVDAFYKHIMNIDLNDFWRVCGVVQLASDNAPKFRSICAAMGVQVFDNSKSVKEGAAGDYEQK